MQTTTAMNDEPSNEERAVEARRSTGARVVLCAVDFSNVTRATVACAADLARRHGLDQIHLVHVAEIVRRDEDEDDPRSMADWFAREEGAAARVRRVAEEVARESALTVVPEFRTGIAWREIVGCARALGADLLVVGAHCRAHGDARAEPSIVEQLVREAPCTVVVVRGLVAGDAAPGAPP